MPHLAAYLATRREAILCNWRLACQQDPALNQVSLLSREEFNDLAPVVLLLIEHRLQGEAFQVDPALAARAYGLRRWHKDHTLKETMRELQHLTQTLFDELASFEQFFPQRTTPPMANAYRQIALILQEMNHWNFVQYSDMQQRQAVNRADVLQQLIDQLNQLATQRAELLRSSSHDMRNGIGLATMATHLLQADDLSPAEREQYMSILVRNLDHAQRLVTNLMDLSRLDTGQERLAVELVEVGQLLTQLVAGAQVLASSQNVTLRANGPASLLVSTDPIKLQRIVQNLLLNALAHTSKGEQMGGLVSVSWSKVGTSHWTVSVQDSGPGLPPEVAYRLGLPLPQPDNSLGATPVLEAGAGQRSSAKRKGEGIGLQIVKGLCELLGARLEVETSPTQGTLFKVRLPLQPGPLSQ